MWNRDGVLSVLDLLADPRDRINTHRVGAEEKVLVKLAVGQGCFRGTLKEGSP